MALAGGVGQSGVRIFLMGGDIGVPAVLIIFPIPSGRDDEYGGKYPCGVPIPDHGGVGKIAQPVIQEHSNHPYHPVTGQHEKYENSSFDIPSSVLSACPMN